MTTGMHRWSVLVVVPQDFNVYEVIAATADAACCPVAEPARMLFEGPPLHMLSNLDMKEC
jgi:hypothetical protein